ncbi:MAG: hypothetical protein K2W95_18360 [Candidatus Obscuribacterales bacterium]|nr:hypothetical protein [Candidatus Obscuribacterales bacterium]
MSVAIERFSSEQESKMHAAAAEWTAIARAVPANREAVEESITIIYRDLKLNPPPIIWCESHAQLVVIHTLLALLKVAAPAVGPSLPERIKSQLTDPWWTHTFDRALEELDQKKELPTIKQLDAKGFESVYGRRRTGAAVNRRTAVVSAIGESLEKEFGLPAKIAVRQHLIQGRQAEPALVVGIMAAFTQRNRNQFLHTDPGVWLYSMLDQDTKEILVDAGTNVSDKDSRGLPPEQRVAQLFPLSKETVNLMRLSDATAACAFLVENFEVAITENQRSLILAWLCLKRNLLDFEFFDNVCLVSECPIVASTNDTGQMHADRGAALIFRDSYQVHFNNGIRIPASVEAGVSIEDIDKQPNVEVRRIMIQRYGLGKYLADSNAQLIDRDEFGTLYKKSNSNDEPLVVLKVINSTPEADGTRKEYLLRVPPYITSAKEAVAWTFDLSPEEYSLAVET